MTAPDTLPPELADLGELLREDRPRPAPGWAAELDARAEAGFPRPPRRSPWRRLRPSLLLPAAGAVAAAVLVVAVVALRDRGDSTSSGGGATVQMSRGGDDASGGAAAGGGQAGGAAAGGDSAGAGSAPRPADAAPTLSSPRALPVPPAPGGDPRSDSRRARRQERSATMTLAAPPRDIEDVADGIVRVTDAVGGYVASSSVASGAGAGGAFELRIPSARLPRALADLSRLAHVRERTQATRDITAEAVSARDRLREARREREGLLRALARATTLNETQSIRARLRIVNGRIAAARASLRRVDNRAAYASLSVRLIADRRAVAGPPDGRWTPGDALRDAVRVLEVAAGIALVGLAIALPLGLLAALGLAAARVAGRRRRERALDLA